MTETETQTEAGLLRPTEVCRMLGISFQSLRRMVEAGAITPAPIGLKKRRYRRSDVERLLKGDE